MVHKSIVLLELRHGGISFETPFGRLGMGPNNHPIRTSMVETLKMMGHHDVLPSCGAVTAAGTAFSFEHFLPLTMLRRSCQFNLKNNDQIPAVDSVGHQGLSQNLYRSLSSVM